MNLGQFRALAENVPDETGLFINDAQILSINWFRPHSNMQSLELCDERQSAEFIDTFDGIMSINLYNETCDKDDDEDTSQASFESHPPHDSDH